jgi:hypothetical protein
MKQRKIKLININKSRDTENMRMQKHLRKLSLASFNLYNIYMNKFSLTLTLIMVVTGNVIYNVFSRIISYILTYCNVDGQSITRQRLGKHVITQATIEIRMFIARCWATRSAAMNSPARNQVASILCGQRRGRCYAMIR